MKPNQLNVAFLFVITLFFCSSSLIAQVTIHQHCNFRGWSIQLDSGNFNSNDIMGAGGLPNDASSIEVPPGYTVTLFSEDNFTGNSITYSNNDDCLVNEGFNDIVSSIKISYSNAVSLFQHCGYSGWSALFGPGDFNGDAIRAAGGLPNDASSLKIAPGYQITAYSGDNFTGNNISFTSDDDCFVNEGFNDIISSFKIEKQHIATLYQHCSYQGWKVSFGLGNYNSAAIQEAGGLPNDASSAKINSGYQITVFTGDNFTGNSITYTNNDDCFWNEGFNDVISSFKIEKQNNQDDWDNFLYPNINIVDQASSHRGSWVFRNALTDPKDTFRALALEGCKKIYHNDNDNLVYAPNLTVYLKNFDGIAYKTGSSPNFQITLSVRWLEDTYNRNGNNLQKVTDDIKGVMSHELIHVYQWGPRVSGAERKGFIEGLADYVRISVGRHQGSSPRRGGNWKDGYTTTGHFLNWMVNNKDPEFAIKFNHTARTYSTWSWESACRNILDQGVQSLWNQYQNNIDRIFKVNSNKTKGSRYRMEDTNCTIESFANESISEPGASIQSKLYPNPTSSVINIEITGNNKEEPHKIAINNLSGISVKKILCATNQCKIDLSDLPSGIYVITIKNSSNQIKKRIIKQ